MVWLTGETPSTASVAARNAHRSSGNIQGDRVSGPVSCVNLGHARTAGPRRHPRRSLPNRRHATWWDACHHALRRRDAVRHLRALSPAGQRRSAVRQRRQPATHAQYGRHAGGLVPDRQPGGRSHRLGGVRPDRDRRPRRGRCERRFTLLSLHGRASREEPHGRLLHRAGPDVLYPTPPADPDERLRTGAQRGGLGE